MAFNIFAAVLVYACYPETKLKTLEEIDSQFGKLNIHTKEESSPKQMLAEDEHVEVKQAARV